MYMNHYLSEPCVDCPSICVKPFISSSPRLTTTKLSELRAFESGLSLICIDGHEVTKFYWLPVTYTLNMCMSFPGMMQGDNENIKVNLVFILCLQLNGFYCCIWS